MKTQLVQSCFAGSEIVNNSTKRENRGYLGAVAQTQDHLFEAGKTHVRAMQAAVCPAGETDAGLYQCVPRVDGVC